MSETLRTEAIVLGRQPWDEKSELALLFCPQLGCIEALCGGLYKSASSLRGRVEPFNNLEIQLVRGRGRWRLTQAQTLKIYPQFYSDYPCLCWGSFFLELWRALMPAARGSAEEGPGGEEASLYSLLGQALEALGAFPHKGVGVSIWMLWRLVGLLGIAPEISSCLRCHTDQVSYFSAPAGGTLCAQCQRGDEGWRLMPETRKLWSQYRKTPWSVALKERFLPSTYAQGEAYLWRQLTYHWPLALKSRRFVKIGERSLESFGY